MARSTLEKMGYRPGVPGRVVGAPPDLAPVFAAVAEAPEPAWIAAFCRDAAAVARAAETVLPLYRTGAHLWLLYPKTGGGIATDITRDRGWGPVEAAGFLPVTQVAVDATWSALRFRRREEIPKLTRRSAGP